MVNIELMGNEITFVKMFWNCFPSFHNKIVFMKMIQ